MQPIVFELAACLPACIHINTLILAASLHPYRLLLLLLLLLMMMMSLGRELLRLKRVYVPWWSSAVELRRLQTFSTLPREKEADARVAEAHAVMKRI